jgi:preprotein translocase subunit Sec63
MRISLGLPSFILNKSYHILILIIFLFIICIVVPYKFVSWYNNITNFEENGLLKTTKNSFKKNTNLNTILINLPFILGNSQEFNLINEPHIKSELTQINNLYDKYKNNFRNKDVLEQIGYRISLNNKKAI